MTEAAELIAGDALKAAALEFIGEMRAKVEQEQIGLHSIFDSWFTRVLTQLDELRSDPLLGGQRPRQRLALARARPKPAMGSAAAAFVSRSLAAGTFRGIIRNASVGCPLSSAVRHRIRHRRAAHLPGRSVADALARHAADEERLRFRHVSGADRRTSAANRFRSRVGPGRQRHLVRRQPGVLRHRRPRPFGRSGQGRDRASARHTSIRATARIPSACSIRSCCARNRIHGWSSKTRTTMWRGARALSPISVARRLSGGRRQRRET